jgi:biopolymer transport protein ExbD
LKALYSGLKGGVLFVDADDSVLYNDVISVIDLSRAAGVGTVATVLQEIQTTPATR